MLGSNSPLIFIPLTVYVVLLHALNYFLSCVIHHFRELKFFEIYYWVWSPFYVLIICLAYTRLFQINIHFYFISVCFI